MPCGHTFRTVADETLDFPAARCVTGHGFDDDANIARQHEMDDVYVSGI